MSRTILAATFSLLAPVVALANGGGYTNHAGNVVAGWPIRLTATEVELAIPPATAGETFPLSIFPEPEKRRIAADFGKPRVPASVLRTVAGTKKSIERSRRRAEKGLCSKEASEDFCAKAKVALKGYLDHQVKSGVLTPAERDLLLQQ